jgi:type II secretory ATPase GspE/PulE/Tfp pilus assembly ATPase PilB-like protein
MGLGFLNPRTQIEGLSVPENALLARLRSVGAISDEQAQILITEKHFSKKNIEILLVDLAFITEKALHHILSEMKETPRVSLKECIIDSKLLHHVPKESVERFSAMPLYRDPDTKNIILAMADIDDVAGYDHMRQFFPQEHLVPVLALRSEISEALYIYYQSEDSLYKILSYAEEKTVYGSFENLEKPISRIVDLLLWEAVQQRSSDIHLEPESVFVRVRYRIDGLLEFRHSFHKDLWAPICVRLKVLSAMDIAENRRPQDGRFSLNILGKNIDFRVSSHPTCHGENICIRILDQSANDFSLEALGFSPNILSSIERILDQPEGMFIVTGPTGSGKTTTLYSALGKLDAQTLNIMTLEDPVEYYFPHIRQTEIKENSSLSFAEGVRSILRQDPDVILVGELRDTQTAHMALRAAMTGHRVLTTLHTNNALGALYRFVDFNLPLSMMAGNISGILAQRLIRLLCPECKTAVATNELESHQLNVACGTTIYEALGCEQCVFTGYKGRKSVAEVIVLDGSLEELMLRQAPPQEIKNYLSEIGFQTILDHARHVLLKGESSFKEVRRAIGWGL